MGGEVLSNKGTSMKRIAIMFVELYLACALYSWGTLMAQLEWEHRGDNPTYVFGRDFSGSCAGVSLTGPLGVIPVAIYSNFNQHGWELWAPVVDPRNQ